MRYEITIQFPDSTTRDVLELHDTPHRSAEAQCISRVRKLEREYRKFGAKISWRLVNAK